jgi:hypothetical protein
MSADNGIYILEMKDQARVIHTQAIENLWWSDITNQMEDEMVSSSIVEYYGEVPPMTLEEAKVKAFELYEKAMGDDFCPVVEYGIQTFYINKTWDEIVKEAKNQ